MQVLISSMRFSFALITQSESAKKGLAIEIKSAWFFSKISSATCGILIRLEVTNGMDTSPLSLCVTHEKLPLGTLVAMVGTLASCHPIPVLIMEAPACSISFAN